MANGKYKGFTLVEALVLLFLFTLVTLVFFQTFTYGTALIQQSKHRLAAIALANQKMEIIRSLDYTNIGTVSGIPAGDILQDEDIQVSNANLHVHTFIQYVDDAFDGTLGGSPNDLVPNDYKRVRVEVSWGGGSDSEKVALFSTFSQLGIEQSVGGGILSINILDSQGNGVVEADVTVTNASVNPSVNVTASTDATGNLFLIGAPASSQQYRVSFAKSGYFGSSSYAPYPSTSFVPTDVHASVVNATVNQASFVMDRSSILELRTVDPFGEEIADINYRLDGGRQIGTTANSNPPEPVYAFGESSVTNASGEKDYTGMSYGGYTWTMDAAETAYTFVGLSPESLTGPNHIDLPSNSTQTVRMVLADEAVNGVLVTVRNALDATALAGATVRMTNTLLAYDETVTTNASGKAYFPETATPGLAAGTYDIEVSLAGYVTKTDTVQVTSGLGIVTVSLTAS